MFQTLATLTLLIVLVPAPRALAQSDDPTPTPPEASQIQEQDRTDSETESGSDQSTAQKPPSTIPKIRASESKDVSPGDKQKGDEKTPQENWIGLGFEPIEMFTAILAFVAVLQLIILFIQGRQIKREFNATHRAKIIVRIMGMEEIEIGKPLRVTFVIINIGNTDGTLKRYGVKLAVRTRTPFGFADSGIKTSDYATSPMAQNEPAKIVSGETRHWELESDRPLTKRQWDNLHLADTPTNICLMGRVIYNDTLGVPRRTSFFRIYAANLQRFYASENPDDEYQD